MKKNIVIIIALIFIILTLLTIVHYYFNQKFDVVLNIKPAGTYSVLVEGKTHSVTNESKIQLVAGKHNISVSGEDFSTFQSDIEVQRNNSNQINIDMMANKITPSLNNIHNLPQAIIDNYIVKFKKTYQKNSWLVMILQNKKNINDKLMLVANKQDNKWVLVLGPGTIFSDAQMKTIPQSLHNDVGTFSDSYEGDI